MQLPPPGPGVSSLDLIGYLTRSAQTLHALDQDLERAALSALRGEPLSPFQLERLIDAQRAGLRIPAGMFLMLASYVETIEASRPPGLRHRVKRLLRELLLSPKSANPKRPFGSS